MRIHMILIPANPSSMEAARVVFANLQVAIRRAQGSTPA
jgi:hypothetical protein